MNSFLKKRGWVRHGFTLGLLLSLVATPASAAPTSPTVTKLALPSNTLQNIDMDLLKVNAKPAAGTSARIKQSMLIFTKTSGLTLSNFRLRRGAADMALSSYAVICSKCGPGNTDFDIESGSISSATTSGKIIISFTSEDDLTAMTGTDYTIHATISGAQVGRTLTIGLYQPSAPALVYGYLANNVAYSIFLANTKTYHLDTSTPANGVPEAAGYFMWTDLSAGASHNTSTGQSGGSKDWLANSTQNLRLISETLSL